MLGQLDWDGVVLPITDVSWTNVLSTAGRLQGLELNQEFFVTYKDEEGDVINVKNEVDLAEAVRWAQEHDVPCLCLHVPFSAADSDSDESWTEIDNGSPRKASAAEEEDDDVEESDKRPILQHHVDQPSEEHSPTTEEEPVVAEEPAVETVSEHSDLEDGESDQEDESAQEDEESVVAEEHEIASRIVEEQPVVKTPVVEEPQALVIEQEPSVHADDDVKEGSPAVLTLEPIIEVFEAEVANPGIGIDRIIEIMCSVNDAYVAGADDKEYFLELLANPVNVDKVLSFLTHPAVKIAISAIAQAERSSNGAAPKATTTQLIKVLYQSPEVLGHLNAIPQLEEVLLRVLRGLKSKPMTAETSSTPVLDEEDEAEEETIQDEEAEEQIEEEELAPKVLHRFVACDGCSDDELSALAVSKGLKNEAGEILGVRYKSAVLPDFDLCESCESTGRFQGKAGPFLKIVDPATAPEAILCALPGAISGMTNQMDSLDWRNPVAREFVEFVRARKSRASNQQRIAPPSVAAMSAPVVPAEVPEAPKVVIKCKHLLKTFEAPHGGFSCDICGKKQPVRSVLHGCRECDFDVCHACYAEKDLGLKIAPPTVAAVAVPEPVSAAPQAKFVCDVTLTDGCAVRAGERLVKTWRVRNSGQERWPQGTRICHVGGDAFGGPVNGVDVPLAAPGEAVGVSVPLTMPQQPGRYTSYWRMVTPHPQSAKFGHRFWVTVNVLAATASIAPVPAPLTVRAPPPPPPPAVPSWTPNMLPGFPPVMLPGSPPVMLPGLPPVPVHPVEQQTQFVATSKFEETVARIADFGFTDIERIVTVLGEVNGDAAAAIERLLEEA